MSFKQRIRNKLFGIDLRELDKINEVSNKISDLHSFLGPFESFTPEVLARLRDIEIKTHHLESRLIKQQEVLKAQRDNIPELRNQLFELRKTKEYRDVFENKKPLVTVRIATYNRADQLVETAIRSVLNQTYDNFEIIIVGDHCTDNTEDRIKELNDDRITFINLPNRSLYPEDKQKRWFVAGSPGMNLAASLAKGDWIAPLDDDDEFSKDHIEKLLKLALDKKAELVYGSLEQINTENNETFNVWSDPPALSHFSFQGAMYMRYLNFFQYDQQSWVVDEPGDWNLCRRMLLSGVYYAATKDNVGKMNMTLYDKKKES